MIIFILLGLEVLATIEIAFWNLAFRIMIHVISIRHFFAMLLTRSILTKNPNRVHHLNGQSINWLWLIFRIALWTAIFVLAPILIALLASNCCFAILA
jgi:hypothetical protein